MTDTHTAVTCFFFPAEDGIRAATVTGVQTCALPISPPASAVVPLIVRVEPAKRHQLTLGGGVEFDPLKTDLHLLVGWDDHNFLGGLRSFHAEVKPGVVLYPLRMQTPIDAPTNLL